MINEYSSVMSDVFIDLDKWLPHALPSAGVIPLLQSFCKNDKLTGKNGYKEFPNARYIIMNYSVLLLFFVCFVQLTCSLNI